ncbi:flavodoxin family protein [Lichenibacterium ramalinae]|uniref:Flavodoxin family protein n=1 Tax=Lichenibacterium ramalinae TaxID=2316527 RepID=A0A4V1RIW5_9HYPH|nr:flavodoxin family protein [Lichenibacterium ramalinae]RYB05985.1 flavodoxin family protein [Lichenibacterium ramalinae]
MTRPSTTTAVVYHSGFGHTKRLADAVAGGAAASLIAIDAEGDIPEAAWATLDAADAIVFGSPTYMGAPSWQFKKFADASSKPWFAERWKDKVFGGFTNSASINGDKLNTLQYFVLLAGQHGGLWVSLGLKPANVKASRRDDPNRMGAYLAPMAQSDADAAPDEMSAGDLETARLYGVRVAEIAGRFSAGPGRRAGSLGPSPAGAGSPEA